MLYGLLALHAYFKSISDRKGRVNILKIAGEADSL
jgi:hypothetical protein